MFFSSSRLVAIRGGEGRRGEGRGGEGGGEGRAGGGEGERRGGEGKAGQGSGGVGLEGRRRLYSGCIPEY